MKKMLIIMCCVGQIKAGCLADFIGKYNHKLSKYELQKIEIGIIKASKPETRDYDYNISPYLLTGLLLKESTGKYWVVNKENAQGLCQLIPKWNNATWSKMVMLHDTDKLTEIESGMFACGEALRERMKKAKGDINRALDFYHGHAHMRGERFNYWRANYNQKIFSIAHKAQVFCNTI